VIKKINAAKNFKTVTKK